MLILNICIDKNKFWNPVYMQLEKSIYKITINKY